MEFASKFLWAEWCCSFPMDESTEALWLFTSTHIYVWQIYHWNISSSETNIKVNTFPFILFQWIVNSCCFNCNLGIFCKRRNFMVWSSVPTYSFSRVLWQWLAHMWRCLNFPLLSCRGYREPGLVWVCTLCQFYTFAKWLWSSPVLADLWTNMLWQSTTFTFGAPTVCVTWCWGGMLCFPGRTRGNVEGAGCLLCQPHDVFSAVVSVAQGFLLGTGPSLPASMCIYPPFSCPMVVAL